MAAPHAVGSPIERADRSTVGPVGASVDVLVVDDDRSIRSSFAEILRAQGMSVAEATDGMDAMRQLQQLRVGAMVLDAHMPRLGGAELLDLLDDPPPVVLVTGHFYDEELLARGPKIAWFLKKPVAPDELVRIVARCLRRVD